MPGKDVSFRKATNKDIDLLFRVSTEAMRPVVQALNPDIVFNPEEEFRKYKEKFKPEEIDIIQYQGMDAGRLRVVRSADSIYVGGIQILPEFQNKGIGTSIFEGLINEAEELNIPVTLEVHNINTSAINLYKKLGFKEDEQLENKTVMKYSPRTQ